MDMDTNVVCFENNIVKLLDQTRLPHEERYILCKTVGEVSAAIRNMVVRGAPAIGVAAAYGMALGNNPASDAEVLKRARPTAVDLFNAVEYMLGEIKNGAPSTEAAKKWHDGIIEKTRKISEFGASLIKDGANVLLHCNAGPLATAGYGTSLGAVLEAAKTKKIFVYVDETRPRFQGALTSWELSRAGIEHKVIVDSSAGFLMQKKMVDLVMVGADRIVSNGDFANKIGTYSLAVLAKENNVPFYVLAPSSTFDFSTKGGEEIKIEERGEEEVLDVLGKRVYGKGASALNLAFDVTPFRYVTSYVTEYGVHKKAEEILRLWKNTKE